MLRAQAVAAAGTWPRRQARGTVTLGFDQRHRRRLLLTSDAGLSFLLDLPQTATLVDGDGLALSDGGWFEVKAAAEPIIEIRAEPALLMRVAWHLGNRHLAAAIEGDHILIREDHVIAGMLNGLGATLRHFSAPFTPERGAYDASAAGSGHGHHHHDHGHDHDHDDYPNEHAPGHDGAHDDG